MRRPEGTLRLLDERPRLRDLLRLLWVLPTWVFLRAAWRRAWARRRRSRDLKRGVAVP